MSKQIEFWFTYKNRLHLYKTESTDMQKIRKECGKIIAYFAVEADTQQTTNRVTTGKLCERGNENKWLLLKMQIARKVTTRKLDMPLIHWNGAHDKSPPYNFRN